MQKETFIKFRCSNTLKSKAHKKCKDYKINLSQYLRSCLRLLINSNADVEYKRLSFIPSEKEKLYDYVLKTNLNNIVGQLSSLGNNLNQIAYQLNRLMKTNKDAIDTDLLQMFFDQVKKIDTGIKDAKLTIYKEIKKI